MPTIKDVAKHAGVSIATVSRVVNNSPNASESTAAKVKMAMQELGYRPNAAARALVSKSSNTLGVLVGDASDPFFGGLINTVDLAAKNHDMKLLIGNGYHHPELEKQAIEMLIQSRCDAMIIHSKGLSDKALIAYAMEIEGMVIINRFIPEIADRCIYLDNIKGAYQATSYLIEQGHRSIACIASQHDIEDAFDRIKGYQMALHDHGIKVDPAYIVRGEPNAEGGQACMNHLFEQHFPLTAVVTYNDYMAVGVIDSCDHFGKMVPQGLSVVGFDDGLIAQILRPRLTTVHYPIEEMTENAVKLATRLASKNQKKGEVQSAFIPSLVTRNSVRLKS